MSKPIQAARISEDERARRVLRYTKDIQRVTAELAEEGWRSTLDAIRAMQEFRGRLIPSLASTPFKEHYLQQLLDSVDRNLIRLASELETLMANATAAQAIGIREGTRDSLLQIIEEVRGYTPPASTVARIEGAINLVGIDDVTVRTAQRVAQDYVRLSEGGLPYQMQTELRQLIFEGVTGFAGRGSSQIIEEISERLQVGKGWTYDAERIFVTEAGRVRSVAGQAARDRLSSAQGFQRLKKRWVWSGVQRANHRDLAASDAALVLASEDFVIPADYKRGIPEERAPYPRAPSLSAANSIYCRCSAVDETDEEVLDDLFGPYSEDEERELEKYLGL